MNRGHLIDMICQLQNLGDVKSSAAEATIISRGKSYCTDPVIPINSKERQSEKKSNLIQDIEVNTRD